MGCLGTWRGALLLCAFAASAVGHDDVHNGANMGSIYQTTNSTSAPAQHKNYNLYNEANYASLEGHFPLMLAHIGFEILAWFFVLPIGKSYDEPPHGHIG